RTETNRRIKKRNRVYTLEAKVITSGVQKHKGSKKVGFELLGSKQVEFKQLGHKQVGFKKLGPGVKTRVYRVEVDKRVGNREAKVFEDIDGGSVHLPDNRTCTIKWTGKVKIHLHDRSIFILENVRYVPGLRRSLISLGTLEKVGYTIKMHMCIIKVFKGCQVMIIGIKKRNRVYTLEAKVITSGVQKHKGSKQVGFELLGSKQVDFKQLGHKQVGFKKLGPGVKTRVHRVEVDKRVGNREAKVFEVSNDDVVVA
nr:zinc finger, CCHC-type [Tanacetum cinerariifolium]